MQAAKRRIYITVCCFVKVISSDGQIEITIRFKWRLNAGDLIGLVGDCHAPDCQEVT